MPRDFVRAVQYLIGSTLLLGIAWYGASDTTDFKSQVYWVVLGIVGTALLSFGAQMFVLDGLREIRRRRLVVMTHLDAALSPREAPADELKATQEQAVASTLMTHYHRRSCALVRGKVLSIVESPATHLEAGRIACGVCAP